MFSQKLTCYNAIFVIKYIHQRAGKRHNGRSAARGAFLWPPRAPVCGRIQFFFFAAALAKTDGPRAMQNTKAVKTGGAKLFLPNSERAVAHFGVAEACAAEAPAAPHAVRQADKREVKI